MGKIQQFKDKPEPNAFGQYYYENDNDEFEDISLSNSVRAPYDKFSLKTLHTNVATHTERDYIIENKLPMVGLSNIKIKKLVINNAGVHHKVKNTHFRAFLFDRNTFDCFKDDSDELKSYTDIHNALYTDINDGADSRLAKYSMFMDYDAPSYGKRGGPGELTFLTDQIILEDLNAAETPGDVLSVPEYSYRGTLVDGVSGLTYSDTRQNQPFNPASGPNGDNLTNPNDRVTSIITEDGSPNYLQFVIWMRGDAKRFFDTKRRRKRLYVFKVNVEEILDSTQNPVAGLSKEINFTEFKRTSGGGGTTPAFVVSEFSVEMNIQGGESADPYLGDGIDKTILENVSQRRFLDNDNFDIDFANMSQYHEPFTLRKSYLASGYFKEDFTPTAKVVIKDKLFQNLQSFKTEDVDRQVCSSPTTVKLNINTSVPSQEDTILNEDITEEYNTYIPPFYKYCVLSWDDPNDEFDTVENLFDKKPSTFDEVLKFQKNNTFIFNEKDKPLYNNYNTPGLKKIKVFVASYIPYTGNSYSFDFSFSTQPPFKYIELLRFKIMTVRIFLDIPVSEFPDFSEVGGSDYSTIPWPNTTAIIGGINEDSKYSRSLINILGGGKIDERDMVDETYLEEAKANTQLGQGIERMDLEQIRYFNNGYDMNQLLLPKQYLGDTPFIDTTAEYLATLPFPYYLNEFDIDGSGNLNATTVIGWKHPTVNRPDIAAMIAATMNITIYSNQGLVIGPESYLDYIYPPVVDMWISSIVNPSQGQMPNDSLLDIIETSEEAQPVQHFFNIEIQQEVTNFISYDKLVSIGESENKIDDVDFQDIKLGISNEINKKWVGDIIEDEDGFDTVPGNTYTYTTKTYDDGTKGVNVRWEIIGIGDAFQDDTPINSFFRIHRNDLTNTLKTYLNGGTPYTFKYQIKFNEFSVGNSPDVYFIAGNTLDDLKIDSSETDVVSGFPMVGKKYFYNEGDDTISSGIYTQTPESDPIKVADLNVWIDESITRYLVYDYETLQTQQNQTTTSFPTFEFSTGDWKENMNSIYSSNPAVIDFDIRFPEMVQSDVLVNFYNGDSSERSFSEETSVGEIFIGDNSDLELKDNCKFELNCGNLDKKSIRDSSGVGNKGLLIGDYKIKKTTKGRPMRRDSFIKVPKKTNNSNGAL